MKYTKNHQFNLIETTDTFSPEPLNQNMETLEQALSELAGRNDTGDAQAAALAKRITTLEGHYFTVGTYTGNGSEMTINLGFTPKCVIIGDPTNTVVLISGFSVSIGNNKAAEIRTGGFYIYNASTVLRSGTHPYIAFI